MIEEVLEERLSWNPLASSLQAKSSLEKRNTSYTMSNLFPYTFKLIFNLKIYRKTSPDGRPLKGVDRMSWEGTPLTCSITVVPAESEKHSLEISQKILRYIADPPPAKPHSITQDIIQALFFQVENWR